MNQESKTSTRAILGADRIHVAAIGRIAGLHRSIVDEVDAATRAHAVVVVGMRGNPMCRRARRALDAAGVPFEYLEYGSYLSLWRRRNALKMWTGWPTFPMVFVRSHLIGGATDLEALIASGELQGMLA